MTNHLDSGAITDDLMRPSSDSGRLQWRGLENGACASHKSISDASSPGAKDNTSPA